MKYITRSKVLDLTYQSHPKLKEYILSKNEITNLDRFILKLGPILFVIMILVTIYALLGHFGYVAKL